MQHATLLDYVEDQVYEGYSIYESLDVNKNTFTLQDFDEWLHMKFTGGGVNEDPELLKDLLYSEVKRKVKEDHANKTKEERAELTQSVCLGMYADVLNLDDTPHIFIERFLEVFQILRNKNITVKV